MRKQGGAGEPRVIVKLKKAPVPAGASRTRIYQNRVARLEREVLDLQNEVSGLLYLLAESQRECAWQQERLQAMTEMITLLERRRDE